MKNFGIENDIDRMYIRGIINKVEIEKFLYEGPNRKNSGYSIYEFNRKREIVRKEHYTDYGSYIKEAIFDHSYRVTGWNVYNGKYQRISTVIYKLNKYKQKIEKMVDGVMDEVYKRDQWGNRIEVYYCNTGGRDLYRYVYRLASIQLSIPGHSIIKLQPERIIHHFRNDDYGNIVERNTFRFQTNQLIYNETSKTNKYGDITEQTSLNPLTGDVNKSVFHYEYDEKNNWILKQEFDEQSNLKTEERRKFA